MSEEPYELPTRWEVELEFVQSLANIQYVMFLAQKDYFSDPAFLNYLDYLNYWRDPKYAKYLVYPNCLHILTLLQNSEFRKQITNPELMNSLMNDMVKRWQGVDEVNSAPTENKDTASKEEEAAQTSAKGEEEKAVPSVEVEKPEEPAQSLPPEPPKA